MRHASCGQLSTASCDILQCNRMNFGTVYRGPWIHPSRTACPYFLKLPRQSLRSQASSASLDQPLITSLAGNALPLRLLMALSLASCRKSVVSQKVWRSTSDLLRRIAMTLSTTGSGFHDIVLPTACANTRVTPTRTTNVGLTVNE